MAAKYAQETKKLKAKVQFDPDFVIRRTAPKIKKENKSAAQKIVPARPRIAGKVKILEMPWPNRTFQKAV